MVNKKKLKFIIGIGVLVVIIVLVIIFLGKGINGRSKSVEGGLHVEKSIEDNVIYYNDITSTDAGNNEQPDKKAGWGSLF